MCVRALALASVCLGTFMGMRLATVRLCRCVCVRVSSFTWLPDSVCVYDDV